MAAPSSPSPIPGGCGSPSATGCGKVSGPSLPRASPASCGGDARPGPRRGSPSSIRAATGCGSTDEAQAIAVLETGLLRHPDAPPAEIFEALLYRAELKGRIGQNPEVDLTAAELLLATHELGAAAASALDEISNALET